MEFRSCFDIIGPVMVGPSSSHTAGVVSIGRFVYATLDCRPPEKVKITLYDSFAQTYRGHGTDKAIIGGLIGLSTADTRIRDALDIARQRGVRYEFELEKSCPYFDHPNTVVITARNEHRAVKVGGVSLGGGLSKIFLVNGHETEIRLSTEDDPRVMLKRLPPQTLTHYNWEV